MSHQSDLFFGDYAFTGSSRLKWKVSFNIKHIEAGDYFALETLDATKTATPIHNRIMTAAE